MLNVAAIEKCALAEFGKGVTCVVFLQGCDMKCGYCQNKDFVPKYSEKAMEATAEQLIEEIPWDEIDALSISGGEPLYSVTLSEGGGRDLVMLLMHARRLRKQTNVDTNGEFHDDGKRLLLEHVAPHLTSISVDIKYGNPLYLSGIVSTLRRCDALSRTRFRMVLYKGRWQRKSCIESGVSTMLALGIRKVKGMRNTEAAEMMSDEECSSMKEDYRKLGIDLEVA